MVSFRILALFGLVMTMLLGTAAAVQAGWVVAYFGQQYTSALQWYTPYDLYRYGGHFDPSRSLLSEADIAYNPPRQAALQASSAATGWTHRTAGIRFDHKGPGSGAPQGLYFNGWSYVAGTAGNPPPELEVWGEDDDGRDGAEEVHIRWSPVFTPGLYYVAVGWWESGSYGGWSQGEINNSAEITWFWPRVALHTTWMWKFCFPPYDYLPHFNLCGAAS